MTLDTRVRGTGAGMPRAASDLAEAAKLYGEICDRPNEFLAVSHLAAAYRLLGDADAALTAYRRAMNVALRLAPLDTVADTRAVRHVIGGPATARATVEHYIGDVYREEVEARQANAEGGPRRFDDALVVGNPSMPTVRAGDGLAEILSPLPESEAESRSIAQRLGVAPLVGGSATERAIRARLARAGLVHLATHGFAFASDARARDSFVALAPDSAQDGLLTVAEIMDDPSLHLVSELVVLSACQSGLGDLKDAEGTIGLPRAFLARGARSVLVSLWSVSDEATRHLMERFYAHWLDDSDRPTKANALRRAMNDVRAMPGFAHPRYWAGFQLIGAR